MRLAAAIVVALAAYAAGGWLGFWLNQRLKLTPWPGAHWRSQVMMWSIRSLIFLIALSMVSWPVVLLAIALLG